MRMSKLPLRCMAVPIVATAGYALAVIVTLGFAFPAAAAAACPTCFGFEREASGAYIEQSASPTDRTEISIILDEARQRVSGFYGSLRSNPRILICVTPSCYQRIDGGGSKGMAIMTFALFLSPHGTTPVIASHELSHIELHARLGLWQTWRRAAPQWFDEGVAVAVSGDPRYLAPVSATDRCLVAPDGPMPAGRSAWIENADIGNFYAKAACLIVRWMAQHDGSTSVVHLADQLAHGVPFAVAFDAPI